MNKEEAKARIEAAEKELAAARKALEEAEKPLTWPELPVGAFFVFRDRQWHVLNSANPRKVIKIRLGHWFDGFAQVVGPRAGFAYGPGNGQKNEPVIRVNYDGTPYIGDPRK